MKTHVACSLSVVAYLCVLVLAGCGSDSSTTPPPADTGPHVYIYAGTGIAGRGDPGLPPRKTELYTPQDVVFAPDSTAIVLDWNNHRVIQVDAATGNFKLLAGVADGDGFDPCPPPNPCTNILATAATLNHPTDFVFRADGNVILCAWHNSELFLLDMSTGLMSRICGDGSRSYNGDEQPAINARVDLPVSAAFDPQGRLVFCDQANMIVRMIDENGIIHTIVGTPPVLVNGSLQYQFGFTGNDGPATAAKLSLDRGQIASPSGRICYDAGGNLYIADTNNHCVRVVDTNGIIHQFAGVGGTPGYAGNGGPATSALLHSPRDVAADTNGNVYIADTDNHVIRMVAPDGIISTVVGRARSTSAVPLSPDRIGQEDGKPARDAILTRPYGVSVDPTGRLWIADSENNIIRILDK